jgi:hypothetical protein
MARFQRFRKGVTAKEANALVATDWSDFEPDEYDPSEDGDDSEHHKSMKGMISPSKIIEAVKEDEKGEKDG